MSTTLSIGLEKPKVSLSCLQCQQRKKKCDKSQPCQACRQSRLECTAVSRARLPRGRHLNKRSGLDLKQRVARLENILANGNGLDSGQENPKTKQDLAWTAVGVEVLGIRELLDQDSLDDKPYVSLLDTDTVPVSGVKGFDVLLYGDSSCSVEPSVLASPPRAVMFALLDVFLYRIDPILKVTHAPSLRTLLFDRPTSGPAPEALKFAVYFTTVCSLDENECLEIIGQEKVETLARFRLATEILLSRADLLSTTDLTVLQAFIIFLAGLRSCKECRSVWALVATAVRLGQRLGLDAKASHLPPFETEMRRRTWYSLGILDLQAAFDGGSYSVLAGNALSGNPPMHINDADISPNNDSIPILKVGFTDMTYSAMTHEMLRYMKKLTHVPVDFEGRSLLSQEWTERLAMVDDCARALHEKYLQYCNTAIPFQKYTRIVGEDMIITLRLLVRRPMHGFHSVGPPPKDGFNILDASLDVLDRALQKYEHDGLRPWKWFAWTKWYALAVLLSELCEHATGPQVDRAWKIVEAGFANYVEVISDGALRNSMKQLMLKACSIRSLRNEIDGRADVRSQDDESISYVQNTEALAFYPGNETSAALSEPEQAIQLQVSLDEMEILSWINWEAFVQNVNDSTDQHSFPL